jgi:drug/metabolite transporter (DMT)-like permease
MLCCLLLQCVMPVNYRFASTYQMLRGTLVIWAGLLTIVILKRRLHSHHWFGMVLITAGAALVGASSIIADRMTRRRYPHHVHAILQVLGVRTMAQLALANSACISFVHAHVCPAGNEQRPHRRWIQRQNTAMTAEQPWRRC